LTDLSLFDPKLGESEEIVKARPFIKRLQIKLRARKSAAFATLTFILLLAKVLKVSNSLT